ncbi:hypothetical protein RIF29_16472 [Crotalaria pallida]|uniref:Ion transport domain-containing protein n=1 Tax=Crotalaria pallida TaxID=3830 RepID=A0AAN9FFF3_CROPI
MASMSNVLDPQRPLIQKWNKFFIITCVMAISVDPLFFYIPMINGQRKCIDFDGALKVTACVLRTFLDVFYILRIIFQFRTGFIAPTRVFGRGELVDDSMAIVKRYLSSNFIIDILSIIPLPQMATLAIIRIPKFSVSYVAKDLLKYTVIAQYVIGAFWFYSQQWRTWAAYFIQAVWRRYWKKKTERSQCEAEDMMHALPNEDGSSSSFGATEQASSGVDQLMLAPADSLLLTSMSPLKQNKFQRKEIASKKLF